MKVHCSIDKGEHIRQRGGNVQVIWGEVGQLAVQCVWKGTVGDGLERKASVRL